MSYDMLVIHLSLVALISASRVQAIDPVHGLVRDFAYVARDVWDQIVGQLKLPKVVPEERGILFQMDETPNPNAPPGCPRCMPASSYLFVGSWHAVVWSRSFQLNTMTDLNNIIDKIESRRPIYTEMSLEDLLHSSPEILCPRISILNSTQVTRFELAYQTSNGRQKSIVGTWENLPDGTYFWRIAPTLTTRLCVAYATVNNPGADTDFVIMSQMDAWPACSSYVAFARTRHPANVNNVRDFMEQQGLERPLNKLQKVYCPNAENVDGEEGGYVEIPVEEVITENVTRHTKHRLRLNRKS